MGGFWSMENHPLHYSSVEKNKNVENAMELFEHREWKHLLGCKVKLAKSLIEQEKLQNGIPFEAVIWTKSIEENHFVPQRVILYPDSEGRVCKIPMNG